MRSRKIQHKELRLNRPVSHCEPAVIFDHPGSWILAKRLFSIHKCIHRKHKEHWNTIQRGVSSVVVWSNIRSPALEAMEPKCTEYDPGLTDFDCLEGKKQTNAGFVSLGIVICWRSLIGRPDLGWRVSQLPAAVWSDAAGSVCLISNLKLTSPRLREGQHNRCSCAQTTLLQTHCIAWKLFFADFVCIFWLKKNKKTALFNIRTLYVAQKRSDGTAAVKYALWNLVVIIATQLNRQQVSGSDMYF